MLLENEFVENLIEVLKSWHILLIIVLVVLDLLVGVSASMRKGEFKLVEVGQFYLTNILPYVIGYVAFSGALAYLKWNPDDLAVLNVAVGEVNLGDLIVTLGGGLALGAVLVSIGGSIIRNATELYTGETLWREPPEEIEEKPQIDDGKPPAPPNFGDDRWPPIK